MADELTQDGRACRLATQLGKDKLCLTRITVNEAVGSLFQIDIEALSTDRNIDFDKALGRMQACIWTPPTRPARDAISAVS